MVTDLQSLTFPWVSHGTADLSHQNPWDTHRNVLSRYTVDLSCLDTLCLSISNGTILSQVIKEMPLSSYIIRVSPY